MKALFPMLAASLLSACAATYRPPEMSAPRVYAPAQAKKADIIRTAKRVLVANGFQVSDADPEAGTLTTVMRDYRIGHQDADCGTTMGINYLLDNRTTTHLGFNILASDNRLDVIANIQAEYKPGDVVQNITLSCVSKGSLDHWMMGKILTELSPAQ